MTNRFFLLGFCLLLGLVGCGQKGPLYPPEEAPAQIGSASSDRDTGNKSSSRDD